MFCRMVKTLVLAIVIAIVGCLYSVEGVLAEPEFLDIELESEQEHITFPMDFEEVFHEPYQNFLRQMDTTMGFNSGISISSELDARLNACYEFERAYMNLDFIRDSDDLVTKDDVNFFGKAVHQIWNFPLDGYVDIGYRRKKYSVCYPRVATGNGAVRMIMPFPNDVVAFSISGFGAHHQTDKSFKEMGGEVSLIHQHHFGTFFGEEVMLRGKYHIQNEGDLPYHKYRLLSSRAGLFLKYSVFMLRLGLKSSGSYDNNLIAPSGEFWIDHHRVRASLTYNEMIQSPTYASVAGRMAEVVFPLGAEEEINRTLSVSGSFLIDRENTLEAGGSYTYSRNHSFPSTGAGDTLVFLTKDCNLASANISLSSKYDFARNRLSMSINYDRLSGGGEFLPLKPRFTIADSLVVPLGRDFKFLANVGYQEGIFRYLNFPEGTDPDFEESIFLSLGLRYRYKDYEFEILAENLAGDVIDHQGYTRGARVYFGIGYSN